MFAPPMMSAPPAMTYPAPAMAPRQPSMPAAPAAVPRAAAPAQPKPVIRAQAPEEPNPARPPLLTLPSPEQLGVAVRPAADATDWTALRGRMKELGVVSFHMDSLTDGRTRFTCWVPHGRPGLTRRIECVAATEAEAVQLGLQQAAQNRAGRP